MSEPKLISPMLDNFAIGDPISDHNGVRCCPAMEKDTEDKYIVKIISVPSSPTQLEALLLSGAYNNKDAALSYFKDIANDVAEEVQILEKLSQLEGFVPFHAYQIVPMEDETGYDIYLLSSYKKTLRNHFRQNSMTQLGAINLGLDLCAALSVCRRSGYIYANLKPENIYITGEHEYRIGDIGFLKLDSLKYLSLPDRYRSQYTAPEILDAYSSLNTTIDIYAVGLILYQAYNDGVLPFKNSASLDEPLPSPAYADYEMAEIILKACSPDPAQRWQDPVEMGQALVSYMQRNGANNSPIIPVVEEAPSLESAASDETGNDSIAADTQQDDSLSPENASIDENTDVRETTAVYTEDDDGNLMFLSDTLLDDNDLEQDAEGIDYEEVSQEVSDMLEQADDLIAHPAPDPVVQPEPIDVPIPPPLPIETNDADEDATENCLDTETASAENTEAALTSDDEPETCNENASQKPKHWLRNTIIAAAAVAVIILGFLFYKNYYLQLVDSISLIEAENGDLTVYVTSHIDEQKLTVVCSDTYGNQLISPVKNGKATFTGLAPNSAFTVKVEIRGFHRLKGTTTAAYTTPAETDIIHFNAVTGTGDGSAILSFTINGPDSEKWKLDYKAEDELENSVTFSGHMVTVSGLTVGKNYVFTLSPVNNLRFTGTNQIEHLASKIIKAENLTITGCANNRLTAIWSVPTDTTVNSWTVRCYNDNGFNETVVVNEPSVIFEGTDSSQSYTVEVTASGMSVSQRAFAAANSITVTDFLVDSSASNKISLSWNVADKAPQGGWLLMYSVDGSAMQEIACSSENTAVLETKIPGASYTFTLQAADGTPILGGVLKHKTNEATVFSAYKVTADSMEFKMCKRPKNKNWDRYDLKKSDYTTTFEAGQKISFLVHILKKYSSSSDNITTLFVIRDANGVVVNTSSVTAKWKSMWSSNYCELDIPSIPKTAGEYSISVYFNGSFVNEQSFSITK